MENELINIFDENRNKAGVATREEVHREGHWHETFHCWFIGREDGVDYIYFQNRSKNKKDYPDLLDITAAGHLLSHETVFDGIREVREELGIDLSFEELVPVGVLEYCAVKENFIDQELANVFLYRSHKGFEGFSLQKEEVSGIVRAEFNTFYEFWFGGKSEITVKGFEMNDEGEKISVNKTVRKNKFVSHEDAYYESVLKKIRKNFELVGEVLPE